MKIKIEIWWLVFLNLLSYNSFSQGHFYIKPAYQTRLFTMSFVNPKENIESKRTFLKRQRISSPYVLAFNQQIYWSEGFDLGLAVGWQSKDKRRGVQLAWNADRAGLKTSTSFREINTYTYYVLAPKAERPIQRFTLEYSHLFKENIRFIDTRFSLGLGLFINYNSNDLIVVRWYYNMYLTDEYFLKSIYFQPHKEKNITPLINIGIENDFYIKNKYIASFKIHFMQGFGQITGQELVHEYIVDNEVVTYQTRIVSRGSGAAIELSRRFQLYPLKKKKSKINLF